MKCLEGQYLSLGDVTDLGKVSVPSVTSQGAALRNCVIRSSNWKMEQSKDVKDGLWVFLDRKTDRIETHGI